MAEPTVIKAEGLYKDFRLPHEKASTVKNLFTGLLNRRKRSYEAQHALIDISFEVKKGEFFGIVGRNGSGKSTLLKVLAGIYQPNKGKVETSGRIVPFIELGLGFNGELSGRENVYLNGAMLGFARKEMDAMYKDIVQFAELERFMDQKLKNYSSGMQVRLAFSTAIRAEADILLVDEVLAVGDADFQRKCFEYFKTLKKEKKTVVFVSHDMSAIREFCDRAVLVEKSKIIEEGKAEKIATAYSRMFIDSGQPSSITGTNKNRWGDGHVRISSVTVHQQESSASKTDLQITVKATAKKPVEEPVVGFMIKNAANEPLTGSNTKIQKQHLGRLRAGQKIEVTWTLQNIFSDGRYFINAAVSHPNEIDQYDWWEDAAEFRVLQENFVPYSIYPPIDVKVKKYP
ncbi:MAG: ABC transporter ATP-binding protein [bacterium]|nr:ABC transporter ATP-binding protein [bacterium]